MTCDGRPRPVGIQDVKVTNDDDEEEENWIDDDEACKRFTLICVSEARLEVIRVCSGPLLRFFGHESCLTHPVQHSSSPPYFTLITTRDLITPLNCRRNNGERHSAVSGAKNRTAQYQILIINIKLLHAIYFLVPKPFYNDMKTLAGLFPLSASMLWVMTNRNPC